MDDRSPAGSSRRHLNMVRAADVQRVEDYMRLALQNHPSQDKNDRAEALLHAAVASPYADVYLACKVEQELGALNVLRL